MKKVKKIAKWFAIILAILCFSALASGAGFFFISTSNASLDEKKLEESTTTSLQIFDINGTPIKPTTENFISIKKLSANTKNAFICAEDKRFYTHGGLDYIRIGGAILSNIKSKSFSEGASTISQQLVKNTQLTSEKTIKRKLKEIKLTKQLEQKYTKEQILEMYLNNIYFGNGCYGIENASKHYFGKSAAMLSLSESALLAGTINAPTIYDIENNQEKAISRRNLILDLMQKYGKITKEENQQAKQEIPKLKLTKLASNNYIFNKVIDEACKITKQSENHLKNSNLKIHTSIDLNLQNQINSKIKSNYSNIESKPNIATIVINNKTNGIVSIIGNKNVLSSKKQPGSTIKPILVYAPAIELGNISPATKILDEKINIGGYSPENADKKFHGYVSVRESLKNSYNIPAVKVMHETGISASQEFAKKLGIEFSKDDNNLATALGGFTNGTTLKELADAYSAFANYGNFSESKFINSITKNSKIIYKKENISVQAMTDSTAYLITDMLKDTSKSGTARRLKNFDYDIASKTGTVGLSNSSLNTDAYNISFTTNHTIISYFGGNNLPESINGATYPTMLTKDILELLYAKTTPPDFIQPNSVVVEYLDKTDYENNILSKTDNENSVSELFAKNNLPKQTNTSLNLKLDVFNFENKKPLLCFFVTPNYTYNIFRMNKNKEELISSLCNAKTLEIAKFEDKTVNNGEIYEYFVEICDKLTNKKYQTNHVKLKTF